MINLGTLSAQTQYLIYTLLFAAILFEFVLILLNRISYSDKLRHNLPACAIIAVLFAVFSMCAFYRDYGYDFPVIIIIIPLAVAAVHIPINTVRSINHRKNNLSPYAIKEAMDDLSTGGILRGRIGQNHSLQPHNGRIIRSAYRQLSANIG